MAVSDLHSSPYKIHIEKKEGPGLPPWLYLPLTWNLPGATFLEFVDKADFRHFPSKEMN